MGPGGGADAEYLQTLTPKSSSAYLADRPGVHAEQTASGSVLELHGIG